MQRTSNARPATTKGACSLVRRLRRDCLPVLLALGGAAAGVQAVELGEMRVYSPAGSQLRASIPLSGADAYESEARCFNGAMLKAVCVEAGMLALRRGASIITHEDFVEGIAQVQMKKKQSLQYYA